MGFQREMAPAHVSSAAHLACDVRVAREREHVDTSRESAFRHCGPRVSYSRNGVRLSTHISGTYWSNMNSGANITSNVLSIFRGQPPEGGGSGSFAVANKSNKGSCFTEN